MAKRFSLRDNLNPEIAEFLELVGKIQTQPPVRAFLVGGLVRDVLLGVESPDIDLLIEGDGVAFAKMLKDEWTEFFPELPEPIRCISFKRYRTAKLLFDHEVLPGVRELDFASTRGERYPTPGAAPEVWPAGLEEDLRRRDFSINAIGVGLSQGELGQVFDLFNGFEHLQSKQLVVLHDNSFVDDPVRVIRGARFIARFGFSFDAHTQSLADGALASGLLASVPKRRLFDELRKALCDEPVDSVVFKINQLGLFKYLLPDGAAGSEALKRFNELKPKQPWQDYLACLCCELPAREIVAWLDEVQTGADDSKAVLSAHKKFSVRERT